MIGHAFFLAWRYLLSSKKRTLTLILGTSTALFLPIFSYLGAELIQRQLTARADSSPILIGQKGNEFDLTMNSLYFRGKIKDPLPLSEQKKLSKYGRSIPIYVNHSASQSPIVGTSLSYFSARDLSVNQGRTFAVLGEVVAGAAVAEDFQLKVGDTIRSDMQNLYNIAGAYPMLLPVVGILSANNTPDDDAFFVDVKTAWTLDGHLHGHEAVTKKNAINEDAVEGENLEATAAIFIFPEINDENRNSFHFHGNLEELPISAVLMLPKDQKSHDQVLGEYALSEDYQAVRPIVVVLTILELLLGIQKALNAYFFVVACSTTAFFALAISLSLRLRATELELMRRIGGSKNVISLMVLAELFLIGLFSVMVASAETLLGLSLIQHFIL